MDFNIWNYVSVLGGIVVIILLLAILFEIIQTFISNRKKQSIKNAMMEDVEKTLRDELYKRISFELDKVFEDDSE